VCRSSDSSYNSTDSSLLTVDYQPRFLGLLSLCVLDLLTWYAHATIGATTITQLRIFEVQQYSSSVAAILAFALHSVLTVIAIETAQKREKNQEYVATGADPGGWMGWLATDSFMYRRHPPLLISHHPCTSIVYYGPSATFHAKFLDQRLS
jgi:hypothetical protein